MCALPCSMFLFTGTFSDLKSKVIGLSRDLRSVKVPLVTKLALDSLIKHAPVSAQPHSIVILSRRHI